MSTASETFSTNKGTGLTIYVPLRCRLVVSGSIRIVMTFCIASVTARFLVIRIATKFSFSC